MHVYVVIKCEFLANMKYESEFSESYQLKSNKSSPEVIKKDAAK